MTRPEANRSRRITPFIRACGSRCTLAKPAIASASGKGYPPSPKTISTAQVQRNDPARQRAQLRRLQSVLYEAVGDLQAIGLRLKCTRRRSSPLTIGQSRSLDRAHAFIGSFVP